MKLTWRRYLILTAFWAVCYGVARALVEISDKRKDWAKFATHVQPDGSPTEVIINVRGQRWLLLRPDGRNRYFDPIKDAPGFAITRGYQDAARAARGQKGHAAG